VLRHTSRTQDHGNLTTPAVATTGGDYPGWEWGFSADTSTAPPNVATTASTSASTPGTSRPSPSTSSPKYSTRQTNSAPRRPPRGLVEPSSGRRGSPTAAKTGSCGVGDLQSARHDPAPSAVTRAIPPPCTHRAYDRRLRGAVSRRILAAPHFYRYKYLLSSFHHLRWWWVAGRSRGDNPSSRGLHDGQSFHTRQLLSGRR
jgi:hypothetical protein